VSTPTVKSKCAVLVDPRLVVVVASVLWLEIFVLVIF
jgi:hypothetical protein